MNFQKLVKEIGAVHTSYLCFVQGRLKEFCASQDPDVLRECVGRVLLDQGEGGYSEAFVEELIHCVEECSTDLIDLVLLYVYIADLVEDHGSLAGILERIDHHDCENFQDWVQACYEVPLEPSVHAVIIGRLKRLAQNLDHWKDVYDLSSPNSEDRKVATEHIVALVGSDCSSWAQMIAESDRERDVCAFALKQLISIVETNGYWAQFVSGDSSETILEAYALHLFGRDEESFATWRQVYENCSEATEMRELVFSQISQLELSGRVWANYLRDSHIDEVHRSDSGREPIITVDPIALLAVERCVQLNAFSE